MSLNETEAFPTSEPAEDGSHSEAVVAAGCFPAAVVGVEEVGQTHDDGI